MFFFSCHAVSMELVNILWKFVMIGVVLIVPLIASLSCNGDEGEFSTTGDQRISDNFDEAEFLTLTFIHTAVSVLLQVLFLSYLLPNIL